MTFPGKKHGLTYSRNSCPPTRHAQSFIPALLYPSIFCDPLLRTLRSSLAQHLTHWSSFPQELQLLQTLLPLPSCNLDRTYHLLPLLFIFCQGIQCLTNQICMPAREFMFTNPRYLVEITSSMGCSKVTEAFISLQVPVEPNFSLTFLGMQSSQSQCVGNQLLPLSCPTFSITPTFYLLSSSPCYL